MIMPALLGGLVDLLCVHTRTNPCPLPIVYSTTLSKTQDRTFVRNYGGINLFIVDWLLYEYLITYIKTLISIGLWPF